MQDIYGFYRSMDHNNVILSFKGVMTPDLLTSILAIMENRLDSTDSPTKTKRKVFNVLVECLQNLYHHIEGEKQHVDPFVEDEKLSALFMITKNEDRYEVMTGNYMPAEDVSSLRARIDQVNAMDSTELKEHYKKVLNDGTRSDKGTAGLGIIDIARKSGNKLGYEFTDIDDKNAFFSLKVKIA